MKSGQEFEKGPPSRIYMLLPPFQIIRHSKNLGESKHFKFDQNYREKLQKIITSNMYTMKI
jgi:hypothetical protein